MSNLKDTVSEQIKTAMKAKDKPRLNALRYLKKLFIENDTSKAPKNELDIVIAHAKKIKDSASLYPDGSDQKNEILTEYGILEEFLPKQLTEEEVAVMIDEIISSNEGANMGVVMKELSPKIKGQFDGKKASDLVKSKLS